jgi:transcriptional regulator with GAF, ATPase, and Fis domain
LQAKLLRVLQDGEFERLGSSKTVKVDVRVIASTNRDLDEEMKKGRFRKDLYYRLNVIPITILPLRERKEDILPLVEHFTQKYCRKHGKEIKSISQKTQNNLKNYHWPGNIRELENVIERSVIITKGSNLQVELPITKETFFEGGKNLEQVEYEYIVQTLEKTNWRISGSIGAALLLGINPETLRSRMRKLGIKKPQ